MGSASRRRALHAPEDALPVVRRSSLRALALSGLRSFVGRRGGDVMGRPQDSHKFLDPYEVWKRVMRIPKISKEAWDAIQRSHFTYWYMPLARRKEER